jgi:hypothetical protein
VKAMAFSEELLFVSLRDVLKHVIVKSWLQVMFFKPFMAFFSLEMTKTAQKAVK